MSCALLDVYFTSEEEVAFMESLKAVQELLTPAGCLIEDCSLLNMLFNTAEAGVPQSAESDLSSSGPSAKSFLHESCMHTSFPMMQDT